VGTAAPGCPSSATPNVLDASVNPQQGVKRNCLTPRREAATECSPCRKQWVSCNATELAPQGRKELAQSGTKVINSPAPQTFCCTRAHSSAIKNSPRAVVWLAGRIVCNSRARPASKLSRERVLKLSIVPATGLHSESSTVSEGYLQSKDLQRDLFSISCLPCRHAPKVAF